MAKSRSGSKPQRGGIRTPSGSKGVNRSPVRTGTAGFTSTAKRVDPLNRLMPMRGGIRL